MPRRQRRHPSKQIRAHLESTSETSSRTSSPRVDSTSPLSLASSASTAEPAAAWTYYSQNSSLERKRRLVELAMKYGGVRAAAVVYEASLDSGSPLGPETEHDPSNSDEEEFASTARDREFHAHSPSLISLLSLPPSHPFAGTTTMEQRQMYWDSLPMYSGATIRTPVEFPSFSSFSTLELTNPLSTEREERRAVICDEERPAIIMEGKGKKKASILETLCCRAQTGTPVGKSRLPKRVGAAMPVRKKYKVKKGLVRMSLDSRENVKGSSSTQTLQIPRSAGVAPPLRAQSVEEEEATPSPPASPPVGARSGHSLSLEERLRNTTLEDLPLSPQDAEQVRALVVELVRDREGMRGTWPPRSEGRPRRVEIDGDT